jgi:hypothetical protein
MWINKEKVTMSIVLSQSDNIPNKTLQKFIDETTELLKLSMVQGMNASMAPNVYKVKLGELKVGGKKKVSHPSVALVAAERLKGLSVEKLKVARLSLGADQEITRSIRIRGINIEADKPVIEQINIKNQFAYINDSTFSETAMESMVMELNVAEASPTLNRKALLEHELRTVELKVGGLPTNWWKDLFDKIEKEEPKKPIVLNKGLRFRVHEVKCVKETPPAWAGSDEISWGGATVDDKGTVLKIVEKFVRGNFDSGERQLYNPPEVIRTFALDSNYPKDFLVTLALAEKDSNGMSKFIEELYQAIKAEVQVILAALGAAAGAAIGAGIGASLGTAIGGPLGTIIGVAAGAILGALIGWLVGVLKDDIFRPQASSLHLPDGAATFAGGSLTSPRATFDFRDHGGHYRVVYDWQITR